MPYMQAWNKRFFKNMIFVWDAKAVFASLNFTNLLTFVSMLEKHLDL